MDLGLYDLLSNWCFPCLWCASYTSLLILQCHYVQAEENILPILKINEKTRRILVSAVVSDKERSSPEHQ